MTTYISRTANDLHDLSARSILPAYHLATSPDPNFISNLFIFQNPDQLAVCDSVDNLDNMVHKAPSLTSLFSRSSMRPPSDASTPSVSRSASPSRSSSPIPDSLLDDDPFAKLDSPLSDSSPELMHSAQSSSSSLSHRQLLLQRDYHDDFRPPKASSTKLVRNSPSLPSLSELARAGGSSYASTVDLRSANAASKRFPVEPWDMVNSPQSPSEQDYVRVDSFSTLADDKGSRAHPDIPEHGMARERVSLRPDSHTDNAGSTQLSHNYGASSHRDLEQQSNQELAHEFPWLMSGPDVWNIVHDTKNAVENEHDSGNEPEHFRNRSQNENGPVMHEAPWQQGRGYHAGMPGGGDYGDRGDNTPSDYDQSDDYGSDAGRGSGHGGNGKGNGNGNGRERGDDDDGHPCSAFSDEEDEESASDSDSNSSEDSEDDVPLAQRIPGALQAQKSIRIKDKAERERKRRERNTQRQPRVVKAVPAPMVTAKAPPQARPGPIAVDDLTKRLLQVRAAEPTSSPQQGATLQAARSLHRPVASPQARHVSTEHHDFPAESTTSSAPLSRRPTTTRPRKQSVSQPGPRPVSPSELPPPPVPVAQQLSRSATAHRRDPSVTARFPPQDLLSPQDLHFSQAGRRSYEVQAHSQPSGRRSHDAHSQSQDAGYGRSSDVAQERETAVARARTLSSAAHTPRNVLQRARTTAATPPAPLPPVSVSQEVKRQGRDATATQHRVFVGDMQRFNTVEIGQHTRARDVLDLVEAQGELRGEAAAQPGGWMLWELAQDFGMERPLREYELPAEIYASWNNNTRLNAFMIKKTPLAPLLAQRAMPSSSPRCSGYVQWESKRGKWTKRWMELRGHSLWLSKRDTGKDETFLCSLSNFDCYYVSRLHKAPRPFIFAVKSTDNLTLFENPADYLHIFACDLRQGQQWMEHILLARSYVLHKERTVLFSAPSLSPPPATTSSSAHKPPPPRPGGPLVNVSTLQAPSGPPTTKVPFQSGSLLAKKSS